MKNVKKIVLIALISATFSIQAKDSHSVNDALAVTTATVTLEQAVSIALQTVPGTAVKAEFDNDDGQTLWEVEIVATDKQQVYELKIDANSAKVVTQGIDKDDYDILTTVTSVNGFCSSDGSQVAITLIGEYMLRWP